MRYWKPLNYSGPPSTAPQGSDPLQDGITIAAHALQCLPKVHKISLWALTYRLACNLLSELMDETLYVNTLLKHKTFNYSNHLCINKTKISIRFQKKKILSLFVIKKNIRLASWLI
ncbi:hypothetical protein SAMN05661044_00147 [Olivibacter domesticus]|uniref:Uncharacterized protein n=1 Tax=Olivibacter domesticus TaxID=407022 RepID=A0A1H7GP13_OLID1|nr:hypothetical protein SAMN05661044_00147 [Olivibacter domesticus]